MMCIIFPITVHLLQSNERGFPLMFTITVVEFTILWNFSKSTSTGTKNYGRFWGVASFMRLPLQRNVQQGLRKSAHIQGGPVLWGSSLEKFHCIGELFSLFGKQRKYSGSKPKIYDIQRLSPCYRWQGCKFRLVLSTHDFLQWEFFFVPHLLWHRTSIYEVSSEGLAPPFHSGIRTGDARITRSLCLHSHHWNDFALWITVKISLKWIYISWVWFSSFLGRVLYPYGEHGIHLKEETKTE
jgi:hypothetical protein